MPDRSLPLPVHRIHHPAPGGRAAGASAVTYQPKTPFGRRGRTQLAQEHMGHNGVLMLAEQGRADALFLHTVIVRWLMRSG